MTPQEAIEYNKNLKEYMKITDKKSEYKFLPENYEALDMAIKALEQQPCEDCISRNTLKRVISELTYWHPTTDGRLEVGGAFDNTVYKVDDIWRLTRVLPSVTPKTKMGKWMPHMVNDKFESIDHDVCSECHTCFYGERTWNYKYCPNCGAKMEVEDEDSD